MDAVFWSTRVIVPLAGLTWPVGLSCEAPGRPTWPSPVAPSTTLIHIHNLFRECSIHNFREHFVHNFFRERSIHNFVPGAFRPQLRLRSVPSTTLSTTDLSLRDGRLLRGGGCDDPSVFVLFFSFLFSYSLSLISSRIFSLLFRTCVCLLFIPAPPGSPSPLPARTAPGGSLGTQAGTL